MPVNLSITVGPLDDGTGRYLAAVGDVGDADDVIGARAGTAEAAALRAVSLYFKVYPTGEPQAPAVTPSLADTAAEVTRELLSRTAVGEPAIRQMIEHAIRGDREVEITYTDTNGVTTVREIEPFRFRDGREGELVESFDKLRGQVRNFRLDRIKRAMTF